MSRSLAIMASIAFTATLAACGGSDPLEEGGETTQPDSESTTLSIGSQDYYSNEIIAEIYAQALEAEGYTINRDFRIGSREVYMPELETGSIDVLPEYTGNFLQYFAPDTEAKSPEDVYGELDGALPDGLRVLDQAPATDQDSYVVLSSFADEHDLVSIGDLSGIDGLTLGGNSELEVRPYGPEGLQEIYGVDVEFTPIEDSGGPLTIKALRDGEVELVNIFTASPVLAGDEFTVLEDPEAMFLASHVVPVVSDRVDDAAAAIINDISAKLTSDELVALNQRSVDDQASAAELASDWLSENS